LGGAAQFTEVIPLWVGAGEREVLVNGFGTPETDIIVSGDGVLLLPLSELKADPG